MARSYSHRESTELRAKISQYWDAIRSSYWFIPAIMSLMAIVIAILAVEFDRQVSAGRYDQLPLLRTHGPAGARSLLAAIGGSMITVAGVTFSVTISSVVYATSQFGPRLLTTFMRDRGNQVTLGTFIATFLYCLMVLRAVQDPNTSFGETAQYTQGFVPHLAMLLAIALALASVSVLIYFIHHIPSSIHVSNVVARIGQELADEVNLSCTKARLDEDALDDRARVDAELLERRRAEGAIVRSRNDGYVQHLDYQGLLECATDSETLVFVVASPGHFVVHGHPLLIVWPAISLDSSLTTRLEDCFALGAKRTQAQDSMFLAQELIEIAVRALSPGTNDPFTAINCINWLMPAFSTLASVQPPRETHLESDGQLRVVYERLAFESFADAVLDRLRPYVKDDRNAALHLFDMLVYVAPEIIEHGGRLALARHAERLHEACQTALGQPTDRDEAAARYRRVCELLDRSNTNTVI